MKKRALNAERCFAYYSKWGVNDMKLNIIKGENGCREIDVDIDSIDGITKNKELRTLYINKKKYRLTLASYKELINTLKRQMKYYKFAV